MSDRTRDGARAEWGIDVGAVAVVEERVEHAALCSAGHTTRLSRFRLGTDCRQTPTTEIIVGFPLSKNPLFSA